MNPLEATGLVSTPLFLGYQPFAVDTSARDRTNELRMKLILDLGERDREARKEIRGLEIPEIEGLPNDTRAVNEAAVSAKKEMIKELALDPSANAFQVIQSPRFQALRERWENATSPAVRAALKQRSQSYEAGQQIIDKRALLGDPIDSQFAVTDGSFVYDPRTGSPLNIQESRELLSQYDEGNFRSNYGALDIARLSNVVTPVGLAAWAGDRFKEAGSTESKAGGPTNLTEKEIKSMDPVLQASYYFDRTRGGANNFEQLNAAVSASMNTMGPDQRRALVQAYMDTEHFAKNSKEYTDDQGRLDYRKIEQAAFFDDSYKKFSKRGTEGKVSFANAWMISEMGRFKESNWFDDLRAVAVKPQAQSGDDALDEMLKTTYTSLSISPTVVHEVDSKGVIRRKPGESKGMPANIPIPGGSSKNGGISLGFQVTTDDLGAFSKPAQAMASILRPEGTQTTVDSPNYVELSRVDPSRALEILSQNPDAGISLASFGSGRAIGASVPFSINGLSQEESSLIKVIGLDGIPNGVNLLTLPKALVRNYEGFQREVELSEVEGRSGAMAADLTFAFRGTMAVPKSVAEKVFVYLPDVQELDPKRASIAPARGLGAPSYMMGGFDQYEKASRFPVMETIGPTVAVPSPWRTSLIDQSKPIKNSVETNESQVGSNSGINRDGSFRGKRVSLLEAAETLEDDYVDEAGQPLARESDGFVFIRGLVEVNPLLLHNIDAAERPISNYMPTYSPDFGEVRQQEAQRALEQNTFK